MQKMWYCILYHVNLIWCGVSNAPRCNYLWQGNTMCIMRLLLRLLAQRAGLSLSEVAAGLAGFANIKGRLQIKTGLQGATILDDTYNANPDSMKAALDVLAQLPAPRIFVMGDIGELGEDESPAMHAEVGSYAREKGIEQAYFVGDFSASAAEAFGEQGLWFADKDPLIQVLCHELPPQANVLVKGSRFMKMEQSGRSAHGIIICLRITPLRDRQPLRAVLS